MGGKATKRKRQTRTRKKRTPEMDEKKKEEKRRRNRILAQQSRDRRKRYIADLENENTRLTKLKGDLSEENATLKHSAKKQFVLALFLAMAWIVTTPVRDTVVDQLKISSIGVIQEAPMTIVTEQLATNLLTIETDMKKRVPSAVQNQLMETRKNNETLLETWVMDVPRDIAVEYWPNIIEKKITRMATTSITKEEAKEIVAEQMNETSLVNYLYFMIAAAMGKALPTKKKQTKEKMMMMDDVSEEEEIERSTAVEPPSPKKIGNTTTSVITKKSFINFFKKLK
mmetsp:Transcript_12689/g.19045  ORF Transcript_12689/g.19045 Transcript_12689/m.19045 type:complete len:284 (+) Transcript_12689:297-1148(+)